MQTVGGKNNGIVLLISGFFPGRSKMNQVEDGRTLPLLLPHNSSGVLFSALELGPGHGSLSLFRRRCQYILVE